MSPNKEPRRKPRSMDAWAKTSTASGGALTHTALRRSKILPLLLVSLLLGLPGRPALLDNINAPRGRFAELHSCEVFAGSCVVNSEVNQAGNYALRVWQFDQGSFNGVPMNGLTVALLEKSDENLADKGNALDAVAYLPPGLSAAQRSALLGWARQNTAAKLDDAHIKIAPLQIDFANQQVSFSAGKEVIFAGGVPEVCSVGGCGEMLWYEPRVAYSSFAVDQLGQSSIVEPLLGLRWMDHGRKTLFVGRFGDPEITVPGLCGAPKTASL
jgi:hypothetical protein